MNNTYMDIVDVTATLAALASEQTIFTGEISTPPTNGSNVVFVGDNGVEVPWVPGEFHQFKNVDLSQIQIKGTVGDKVIIISYATVSEDELKDFKPTVILVDDNNNIVEKSHSTEANKVYPGNN